MSPVYHGQRPICSGLFLGVFLYLAMNAVWFCAMMLLVSQLSALARNGTFQRGFKGVTGIVVHLVWDQAGKLPNKPLIGGSESGPRSRAQSLDYT